MKKVPSLTWVHVSDLHFGHGDAHYRFDQVGVTDALLRDAADMRRRLGPPDLLLVTGDIAFSGQPSQYQQAKEWLKKLATELGDEVRVLVIPGNHDIDRKLANEGNTFLLHNGLRNDPRHLDRLLAHPQQMQSVWSKLEAYSNFAGEFNGCAIDSSQPFWLFEVPTTFPKKLVVCGLNTVLLSFDENDSPKNLRLGRGQLLKAIEQPPRDALLLVLQHHPGEWLLDGNELHQQLLQRAHIQFSGHVHQQHGILYATLSSSARLQFMAGAAHADSSEAAPHAYSWGQLNIDGLAYYSRIWLPDRQAFTAMASLDNDDFKQDDHAFIKRARLPSKIADWLPPSAHQATSQTESSGSRFTQESPVDTHHAYDTQTSSHSNSISSIYPALSSIPPSKIGPLALLHILQVGIFFVLSIFVSIGFCAIFDKSWLLEYLFTTSWNTTLMVLLTQISLSILYLAIYWGLFSSKSPILIPAHLWNFHRSMLMVYFFGGVLSPLFIGLSKIGMLPSWAYSQFFSLGLSNKHGQISAVVLSVIMTKTISAIKRVVENSKSSESSSNTRKQ